MKWWELLLHEFLHEGVLVLQKEIPNIDPDLISGFPLQVLEFLYQIHNMSLDGKFLQLIKLPFNGLVRFY